jgi:hypothetical protein
VVDRFRLEPHTARRKMKRFVDQNQTAGPGEIVENQLEKIGVICPM